MSVRDILLALLRYSIKGESLSDEVKNALEPKRVATLLAVAENHGILHLIAHALTENALALDKSEELFDSIGEAVRSSENMNTELEKIKLTLENAKISFIVLKGAVIRPYYREAWMRTSCDIDVLVNRKDIMRATALIENELGYKTNGRIEYHNVSLFSENGVHLELHHSIKEDISKMDKLLERVWEYSYRPDIDKSEQVMLPEFFMLHQIAHMAYHFLSGGCGIKPCIDIYILRNNLDFDEKKLRALLSKCSLEAFYEKSVELTLSWLDSKPLAKSLEEMEKFIFTGGAYGTRKNLELINRSKKESKLSKIFAPYDKLCARYQILNRHKYLMPVFQVARWFSYIFRANKKAAPVSENGEDSATKTMLKELGLD